MFPIPWWVAAEAAAAAAQVSTAPSFPQPAACLLENPGTYIPRAAVVLVIPTAQAEAEAEAAVIVAVVVAATGALASAEAEAVLILSRVLLAAPPPRKQLRQGVAVLGIPPKPTVAAAPPATHPALALQVLVSPVVLTES